jgi:hypothetical protein
MAKRDAQRELKGRTGVRKKGAFNLASVRAGGLGDDKQPGAGVGGKLAAAPNCASREFGLGVGGGVELNYGGRLAFGRLAPLAPCVEDLPLDREDAVKARQKQWRTFRCLRPQKWHQFQWQAAWAEQVAGAAKLIKSRKPTAESSCVLLPADAG